MEKKKNLHLTIFNPTSPSIIQTPKEQLTRNASRFVHSAQINLALMKALHYFMRQSQDVTKESNSEVQVSYKLSVQVTSFLYTPNTMVPQHFLKTQGYS